MLNLVFRRLFGRFLSAQRDQRRFRRGFRPSYAATVVEFLEPRTLLAFAPPPGYALNGTYSMTLSSGAITETDLSVSNDTQHTYSLPAADVTGALTFTITNGDISGTVPGLKGVLFNNIENLTPISEPTTSNSVNFEFEAYSRFQVESTSYVDPGSSSDEFLVVGEMTATVGPSGVSFSNATWSISPTDQDGFNPAGTENQYNSSGSGALEVTQLTSTAPSAPTFGNFTIPPITQGDPTDTISGSLNLVNSSQFEADDHVQLSIDGAAPIYTTLNSNGTFTFDSASGVNTSLLSVGNVPLTFTFFGDIYNPGATAPPQLLKVNPPPIPQFGAYTIDPVAVGTQFTHISGSLMTVNNVQFGGAESMDLQLNGTTYQTTLNPDGSFVFSVPTSGLMVGTFPLIFSYNGDNRYGANSDKSQSLTVNLPTKFGAYTINPIIVGTATTTISGSLTTVGNVQYGAGEQISLTIDGTTVQATLNPDGTFKFSNIPTSGLSAGNVPLVFSYNGDSNYQATSDNTQSLTVIPFSSGQSGAPTFDDFSNTDVEYGTQTITIAGKLNTNSPSGFDSANEKATLSFNRGTTVTTVTTSVLSSGLFVFLNVPISGLNVGNYPLTVTYIGDSFSSVKDTSQTLTVVRADTAFSQLAVDPPTITYGTGTTTVSGVLSYVDSNKVVYGVPDGTKVTVTINGVSQSDTTFSELVGPFGGYDGDFSVAFLTKSIPASDNPYQITVSFAGTANLEPAPDNTALTLTVNPATPTFGNVDSPTISFGEKSTIISGQLNFNAGDQVPTDLDFGVEVHVTGVGANGTAVDATQNALLDKTGAFFVEFNTSNLPASATPYKVTYGFTTVDGNFKDPADATGTLTVEPLQPLLSGLANPLHIDFGTASTTVTGQLLAGPNDQPVPVGDPLLISFNGGAPVTADRQADGSFTATINAGGLTVTGGPYNIVYSFNNPGGAPSDPNYGSLSNTTPVVIDQVQPTFSNLSAPTIAFGTDTTTISGHLNANAGTQTFPAGETVAILLNGDTEQATLLPNGEFSFAFGTSTLGVLESSYTISFSYAGDDNFKSASDTSTLAVTAQPSFSGTNSPTITFGTATTTISGHLNANAGDENVPAGQTVQITVNGVTVAAPLFENDDFSVEFNTSSLPVSATPYAISFNYAGDANFLSASDTTSSTLTVTKATPTFSGPINPSIVFGTATATITGHLNANTETQSVPAGETILVTFNGTTVSAKLDSKDNFSAVFATSKLTVSTTAYPIQFAYDGDTNFNDAVGFDQLTITKATPTVVATDAGGTYSGRPFPAKSVATGIGGAAVTGVSSFQYFNGLTATGTGTIIAPTNAGTYTVVASFNSSNPNYGSAFSHPVTFTIKPATPLVVVTDLSGTYTGKPFTATAKATGVGGATVTGTASFMYYTGSTVNGTGSSTAPTNLGTYTVVASFKSSNTNYGNATSAAVTFTIKAATPTVVVTDPTGAYTGKPFTATATVTGPGGVTVKGTTTFTYYVGRAATGTGLTTAPTNLGTYTVVASFVSGNSNYVNAKSSPVTFTINQATPTLAVKDASGAYTGKPFTATASVTGGGGATISGTTVFTYYTGTRVTRRGGSSTAPTTPGTYTVEATFTSTNSNYTNATSTSVTFTISPATPTVRAMASGGIYTGKAFAATDSVTGLGGATVTGTTTLTYYVGTKVTGTGSTMAPTNAGIYTVVVTFRSTNPDYANATSSPVTFTIEPARTTINVNVSFSTYTGQPIPATATVTGFGGVTVSGTTTLTYYVGSSVSGTGSTTAPTNAGTYTVVAKFVSSNADYSSISSVPITFAIEQATPDVEATDPGGTFTGSPFPATVTVTGVNGATVGGTTTVMYYTGDDTTGTGSTKAPTASGTYTVVAMFVSSNTNYADTTSAPVTFEIV